MIFGETKVLGPYGLVPIKDLKVGDPVWSFGRGGCVTNKVRSVERGFTREAVTVQCYETGKAIRCAKTAQFWDSRWNTKQVDGIRAGDMVTVCDGAEVYKTPVGPVMREELLDPVEVVSVTVGNWPHNILANGVLVRA